MQKMTRVIASILVLAAALLAILAFSVGRRNTATPAASAVTVRPATAAAALPDTKLVNVVIAAKALPAGVPLDRSALDVVRQPTLPSMGYASPEALLGAVPAIDVAAGRPILAGDLAQGLALMLKPGERALAVPVDEVTSVGNRIAPGDYVDVFISLKNIDRDKIQTGGDDTQTRLLLSRLRVLAYGNRELGISRPSDETAKETEPARPGSDASTTRSEKRPNGSASSEPTRTAVLAVPVEFANRLLLGAQQGKLALALRHPGDHDAPDSDLFPAPTTALAARPDLAGDARRQLSLPANQAYAGIDMPGLIGHEIKPKPVSLHRPIEPPVEIIRGASRQTQPASP